jgi:hypothetical protein
MSISRAGSGSGRAEKISGFSGRENPDHDRPMGRVGPQFSDWARAGPGRTRILHCKITKNSILGRARVKKNRFEIFTHARLVKFGAKNAQV